MMLYGFRGNVGIKQGFKVWKKSSSGQLGLFWVVLGLWDSYGKYLLNVIFVKQIVLGVICYVMRQNKIVISFI